DYANPALGWKDLGRAVVKWQVRPDGVAYVLQADYKLMVEGALGWDNTKDFALTPDGRSIWWLGNWRSGNLLQRFDYANPAVGWKDVAHVAYIEMRNDGALIAASGPSVFLIKTDLSIETIGSCLEQILQDYDGRIYIRTAPGE